ncbi:MAG: lysophospholipase [Burkholderiaceae bacterium]|nr:lysophospholipase [Burkholderiaceae bacterium]MCD6672450.1 alpha/beta hydrolase [Burkholderiaceae bacterium]
MTGISASPAPAPQTIELTRPDRAVLRGLRWRCPGGARAVVVHGLGEHAARQRNVAEFLARRGFDVVAFDHRGHGRSDGARGALRRSENLVDDLAAIVDSTASAPILLVGHSMGGLVALRYALAHPETVAALVLSSPALDPTLSLGQKLLLATMSRLAPDLAVGNGLDASKISHDPAVVRAYREDPLVHDRITARLARFIVDGARDAIERAAMLAVPTLLLVAGDDRLVSPAGSRRFAQRAPRGRVDERVYEGLWHELFNESEPGRTRVFGDLGVWLDARK